MAVKQLSGSVRVADLISELPTDAVAGCHCWCVEDGKLYAYSGSSWTQVSTGGPASSVVAETSYGQASAVGTGTDYARNDHTHGSPSLGTSGTTACAGNDARLSDARTPTAHTHPKTEVDDAGTWGIGEIPTGTTSSTVCIGNDARLSDARTPTAHATSHKTGGSDAVKLDELAAPTDVTTLDVSTTLHGLCPKAPNDTSKFLRGDGTWNTPAGTGEAFPVGSVFIAVVSTNPGTLLGYGTWSAIAAGRVLVGLDAGDTDFDTVEETGGAKTHTMTSAEMPAHTHPENVPSSASGGAVKFALDTNASGTADAGIATGSAGGGGAHNNVQPYFVCYFWKRTA